MALVFDERLPLDQVHAFAARRLEALGLAHAAGAAVERVTGVLEPGPGALSNPFSGEAIERVPFFVDRAARLVLQDPPLLAALPPQPLLDHADVETAVAALQDALVRR